MISRTMRRFYVYSAIFGLAFVMVLVPLVVPMLTREADYSVFNTGWNGCSDFYKDYISTYGAESVATTEDIYLNAVLRDLTHLDTDPRDAMLLIIGPSKPYGAHELAYLRTFLSEGGRIILADDFGVGNDILSFLGVDARFSGVPLLDLAYETSALVPVTFFGSGGSTLPYTALLNHATALSGVSSSYLYSSPSAFLDTNGNGVFDEGERRGPFPLISRIPYDEGVLILIADPSIFINDMYRREDNRALLLDNISVARAAGNTTLYVDEAHFAHAEAFSVVDVVLATNKNAYLRYGVAAVLLLMLGSILSVRRTVSSLFARAASALVNRRKGKKEQVPMDARDLAHAIHEDVPAWDVRSLYAFLSKFRKGAA